VSQTDAILEEAANGNAAALDFLRKYMALAHMVDDVVDGEITDREGICRVFMALTTFFSCSQFYQDHRQHLFPVIIASMDNHANSVMWEGSAETHKARLADVLRSTVVQVVHFVGLICHGGDVNAMRQLSEKSWLNSWATHHDGEGNPI